MSDDQTSTSSNDAGLTEENIKQLEADYSQIKNASFKSAADGLLAKLKTGLESATEMFQVSQAQAEVMSELNQLQMSTQWSDDAERIHDWPKAMALFTNVASCKQQDFA